MRRMVTGLVCALLIVTTGGGAKAQSGDAGAMAVRAASALWWRHGANAGTVYYLEVYDRLGTLGNRPAAVGAYFAAIPCDLGKRDQPVDCKWRHADHGRVKVDSFEVDPLMNEAHAVLHRGAMRGELTWTGHGDYSEPFLWQSVGELFAPPYFTHIYANVIASIGRRARLHGDLFGLDLKRSELSGAGIYDFLYAGGSACLTGSFCWAEGR